MPAHFQTDQPAKRFDVRRSSNRTHDYVYFGAFLGNELVGYAYCLIAGEVCCLTHILGHAKHLARGVVPQLIIDMAKYLFENHPLVQYYAYGSYFGCRDSMKRFKRKFAFVPHQVTWRLGNQNEGQNMQLAASPLNRLKRLAKRVLRGPTAMERVLQELSNHGVCVAKLRALEVFAGEGTIQTVEYAAQVGDLELWEIRPQCEAALRRNFPKANVKITDSFQEITTTANRYDLIVVDNPMSVYAGEYCEHFQLFPSIFRICAGNAALVLAVIPRLSKRFHARYPYLFSQKHLAGRSNFYGTEHPEDVSIEKMLNTYQRLAEQSGMNIDWSHCARRSHKSDIHNLVLSVKRRPV